MTAVVTVRFREDDVTRVRAAAAARGITVSQLLRAVIRRETSPPARIQAQTLGSTVSLIVTTGPGGAAGPSTYGPTTRQ